MFGDDSVIYDRAEGQIVQVERGASSEGDGAADEKCGKRAARATMILTRNIFMVLSLLDWNMQGLISDQCSQILK